MPPNTNKKKKKPGKHNRKTLRMKANRKILREAHANHDKKVRDTLERENRQLRNICGQQAIMIQELQNRCKAESLELIVWPEEVDPVPGYRRLLFKVFNHQWIKDATSVEYSLKPVPADENALMLTKEEQANEKET